MSSNPRVTFDFGTRNLARVKRDVQSVLDLARGNANTTAGRGTSPGAARNANAERAAARAALLELARRGQAYRTAAAQAERGEQAITAAASNGSARRVRGAQGEATARARSINEVARAAERAEARATRATERASQRRRNLITQGVREVGSAAMGLAGNLHGQIQDARQRSASVSRTAGLAFFQAGATTPGEIAARVAQTRAFALRHGMTSEELMSGANAAQTEFSSLQGATEGERQTRFTNMLETMRLARNTGNDPGEFARLQGMLSQTGFDPAMQRRMLLYTAGASQAGAVEAGSLTREAMGSIMRRMQDAMGGLGPNATEAQRSEAAAGAFREHVAELQVFRGRGSRVGLAGNSLANMQDALRGTNRQDKLLNNIENARAGTTDRARQAQLDRLRDSLFEADPQREGRQRLRQNMQNPLALASAYIGAMGEGADANGLVNLLAGGGHGNAQSMLAPWRNLLGQLVAADTTGRTGAQRVMALQNPNVALTEQRVREGESIFAQDALSGLNRETEAKDAALSDNTSALVRLSNQFAAFTANNPFGSAGLGAGGMLAGSLGARGVGALGSGAMGLAGRGAAGLVGTVAPGAGAALAGGAGAAGLGAGVAGVTVAAAAGLGAGSLLEPIIERATRATQTADGTQIRYGEGQGDESVFNMGTLREFGSIIASAIRANPPVVQVSPQVAAQAAGLQRTNNAAAANRT